MPIVVVELDGHDRTAFECGKQPLNDWFKYQASQDVKNDACSVYLAIDDETDGILGFYTLSSWGIPFVEIPDEMKNKVPRYACVPATLVGRLAVDSSYQGRGLGPALLVDALKRVAGGPVKSHSLIVDAKDEEAAEFYRKFGFMTLVDKPLTLFLPIKTALKASEATAKAKAASASPAAPVVPAGPRAPKKA